MSREIKFRAWLKGKHNNGGIDFGDDGFMDYDTVVKDGCYCDVEGGWDIHGVYSSVPLMQYTGIKDKNGKEIYEGDIVVARGLNNVKGDVIFERGCFMISPYYLQVGSFYSEDLEVIGNIYENKDLLKNA